MPKAQRNTVHNAMHSHHNASFTTFALLPAWMCKNTMRFAVQSRNMLSVFSMLMSCRSTFLHVIKFSSLPHAIKFAV